jgi:phage gpG-like protein
MSSNLQVSMKAEALLARLAGTYDRLRHDLRIVVQRLAIKAQGVVKQDKLTGQVLHVRTGTLRRSINQLIEETATGVFGKVGTNVKYAHPHEFGFDGVVNVRGHVRHTKSGGTQNVRAHARHMHLPERSFLRSTLRDMQVEIQSSLRATILKAVKP